MAIETRSAASKRIARKCGLSRITQRTLSLIASEQRKGSITPAEARMLERHIVATHMSTGFQISIRPTTTRLHMKLEQLGRKLPSVIAAIEKGEP